MTKFYSTTFGWQPQLLGPEMGEYVVVSTTEVDEKTQRPKEPGAINGGFYKKNPDNPNPSVVISVDDIRAAMKKVEENGGKLVNLQTPGEPIEIPGIGLYASFVDTEGNRVSLLQVNSM